MLALIYLTIIPDILSTSYESSLTQWARQALPAAMLFDFDNLSDSLVMQYASDLLQQSEKVVLVVEVKSAAAPASKLLPFLEKCIAHPHTSALLTGKPHPLVTRMLGLLPAGRLQSIPDLSAARPIVVSSLA
ncbi:MAG: hypothetical protein V4714_11710 [Bacteroidota bacterium]